MGIKEINIRGLVQPEITINGKVSPTISFRGEVQKTAGTGTGMIIKTTEEWNSMPSYMAKKGIIYVYSDYRQEEDPTTHEIKNIPATKIGDGMTYLIDLPFSSLPITQEDIDRWNDHVGVYIDEETGNMVFYH